MPEQGHEGDQGDEADGDEDQEIPDLDDHLLEVAALHERGLGDEGDDAVEIRVGPGVHHRGQHLALLDDRAGVGHVARLLADREGFAGEGRLVDEQVVAAEQLDVGRHDVADAQLDDVAGHEVPGRNREEPPAAQGDDLGAQVLFQGPQGVQGPVLLEEIQTGVDEQHHADDAEVLPFPDHGREDPGGLDHPGDGAPEPAGDAVPDGFLFFPDLVGAEDGQAAGRLRIVEALGRIGVQRLEGFLGALLGIIVGTSPRAAIRGPRLRSCVHRQPHDSERR